MKHVYPRLSHVAILFSVEEHLIQILELLKDVTPLDYHDKSINNNHKLHMALTKRLGEAYLETSGMLVNACSLEEIASDLTMLLYGYFPSASPIRDITDTPFYKSMLNVSSDIIDYLERSGALIMPEDKMKLIESRIPAYTVGAPGQILVKFITNVHEHKYETEHSELQSKLRNLEYQLVQLRMNGMDQLEERVDYMLDTISSLKK